MTEQTQTGYENWSPDIQDGLAACDQLLANGEVGAALAKLSTLSVEPTDLPFLRVQMLHSAGLPVHAYEAIKALGQMDDPDPEVFVRLAHVCGDAGADADACGYLARIGDQWLRADSLLVASRVAARIGSTQLQDHFESRLIAEYPELPIAGRLRWRRALAAGRFAEAALVVPASASQLREPLFLLQHVVDKTPIDSDEVDRICQQHVRTALPPAVIHFLIKHGLLETAMSIAIDVAKNPAEEDALALLALLDAFLTKRDANGLGDYEPAVRHIVTGIVSYLATRPERGYVRHRLAQLLSVERSGEIGLPIILAVTVNLAKNALEVGPQVLPSSGTFHELKDEGPTEARMCWLSERAPCIPGRTALPRELLPPDPDRYLAAIESFLKSGFMAIESDQDVEVFKKWLLLGGR